MPLDELDENETKPVRRKPRRVEDPRSKDKRDQLLDKQEKKDQWNLADDMAKYTAECAKYATDPSVNEIEKFDISKPDDFSILTALKKLKPEKGVERVFLNSPDGKEVTVVTIWYDTPYDEAGYP